MAELRREIQGGLKDHARALEPELLYGAQAWDMTTLAYWAAAFSPVR